MILVIIGLVAVGFISGFIFCSLLAVGERADESLYIFALNELRKELTIANDTIFELANQNADLKDSVTFYKEAR